VRLLRSCKAELYKAYRINGSLYNITIVEEVVNNGGVDLWCKCTVNHEGSSDSVSSLDSFVANSLLSAKLSNEEDGKMGRWSTRAWKNCLVACLTRLWKLCYLQEYS